MYLLKKLGAGDTEGALQNPIARSYLLRKTGFGTLGPDIVQVLGKSSPHNLGKVWVRPQNAEEGNIYIYVYISQHSKNIIF